MTVRESIVFEATKGALQLAALFVLGYFVARLVERLKTHQAARTLVAQRRADAADEVWKALGEFFAAWKTYHETNWTEDGSPPRATPEHMKVAHALSAAAREASNVLERNRLRLGEAIYTQLQRFQRWNQLASIPPGQGNVRGGVLLSDEALQELAQARERAEEFRPKLIGILDSAIVGDAPAPRVPVSVYVALALAVGLLLGLVAGTAF